MTGFIQFSSRQLHAKNMQKKIHSHISRFILAILLMFFQFLS